MARARKIGPLKPWCCTVYRDGLPFGLTLYGLAWEQIEDDFPEVRVEGELISTHDAEIEGLA